MQLLTAIVSASLRHRGFVLLGTLAFVVLSVRAALVLPVDAVPDLTNVQVQVVTSAPALGPLEIEQYVSVPVERALAGIPGTVDIRSLSRYGLSLVTIVFGDNVNIYFARQLVSERLVDVQSAVSSAYGRPQMAPVTTALGEVFQFVLQNDALGPMELRDVLDWQVAPVLRAVPGVVEVNGIGGDRRAFEVALDPHRLQAAALSVGDVVRAVESSNRNAGGGYIEHNREHFVIGSDGLVQSLGDLQNVVVGSTPQGVPITIATLGEVRFAPTLRRGAASRNGQGEVVVGFTLMLMGENASQVVGAVKARLHELLPTLPSGTRIQPFYDRSLLVQRTMATVGRNLLEGAALVVFVLLLLLGDLRAGLVVAATIPLAMLFAVSLMSLFGMSGNLMSLGAIDFGLIVDGAVIIVENAVRRMAVRERELGRVLEPAERREVIGLATVEVRAASVFGEAIIAIVYLPMLMLSGIEGKLFRPMASTVLLCLLGAFITSLTLVPVLTDAFVRAGSQEAAIVRLLSRVYQAIFARARRWPGVTVGVSMVVLALAAALFTELGAEFIPQLDEGDILVEVKRLPGTALSESLASSQRMERALVDLPEVEQVVAKTGSPELALEPMGVEETDLYIKLRPREHWPTRLTKEILAKDIMARLERHAPEVALGLSQPIQMRTNELVAGVRADVAAMIYGPDLDTLARLGGELYAAIGAVHGVVDLRQERVAGLAGLRVRPDRARLARYGLTVEDVNQVTEALAVGIDAGRVMDHERRFPILVRMQHGFDGDVDILRGLPLRARSGQMIPLGDVAELALVTGPAQVSRSGQSRRLSVEFNVRDRDLLSAVEEARRVSAAVTLPQGYRLHWGGQFEHYTDAKQRLLWVVPLALLLIGILLWLAIGSVRDALLVFSNVPFAIVGGVFALGLRGLPFSISAAVGFIALFGVAVLNGLVLVAFAKGREAGGSARSQAIAAAAAERLRPVMMTALVAALGFFPMALSNAPGAEVQRPLATVVIGGLISATLLTLIVLPIVYGMFQASRAPIGK